jgi:hypothetical protein
MIRRRRKSCERRGLSAIEGAAVYPTTIFLLMGTVIMSLGIFRYQQLQFLAREGARYASVHGPTYASESGQPVASPSTVLAQVQGMAVGLSGLSCSVQFLPEPTMPCTVSVALTYTWTPEAFFSPITWTVTSTMPVTY